MLDFRLCKNVTEARDHFFELIAIADKGVNVIIPKKDNDGNVSLFILSKTDKNDPKLKDLKLI